MSAFSRRTLLLGTLGAVAMPVRLPAAPPRQTLRFKITDLGTLPHGDYSSANSINNQGQIVGLSSTGATLVDGRLRDTRAVLWQNGTVTDLVGKQFIAPQASRINNRGQILITWQYIGADRPGGVPPPEPYAVLWDRKVQHVWRARDYFLPNNLNDQGQLVGNDIRGNWSSMVWRDGKLNTVLMPRDTVSSQAGAINNAGTVAGTCRIRGDLSSDNLFVTDQHSISMEISNAQRGDFVCKAINQRGQAAGIFRETASRIAHLFLWQDGKLEDLAVLGRNGAINAVNSAGYAVGRTDAGACAYIDGALHDLNALVPHDSGWHLWEAADINDHGQIVGIGMLRGQFRAFLLTPVPRS